MDNESLIQQIYKRANKKYMFALSAVALMAVTSFMTAHQIIASHKSKGSLINISGRQRMLTQRIGMYLSLAMHETDANQKSILLEVLSRYVNTLETSHDSLIYKPQTLAGGTLLTSNNDLSGEMREIYFGPQYAVDKKIREFISSVRRISEGLGGEPVSRRYIKNEYVKIMSLVSDDLLTGLEKVVTQHEAESEKEILRLERVELGVLVLTLSLLIFELFYIYLPMNGSLKSILRILAILKRPELHEKEYKV